MMADWKSDIKKTAGTLNEILGKIDKQYSNEKEVTESRELIKKINTYPSLYVHNYDLLSTLLSEKKKVLETYLK